MNNQKDFKPYVPAEKITPEITVTSIIMGIILAVVFGAANADLGLRVGMTVSASMLLRWVLYALLCAKTPFSKAISFRQQALQVNLLLQALSLPSPLFSFGQEKVLWTNPASLKLPLSHF